MKSFKCQSCGNTTSVRDDYTRLWCVSCITKKGLVSYADFLEALLRIERRAAAANPALDGKYDSIAMQKKLDTAAREIKTLRSRAAALIAAARAHISHEDGSRKGNLLVAIVSTENALGDKGEAKCSTT